MDSNYTMVYIRDGDAKEMAKDLLSYGSFCVV